MTTPIQKAPLSTLIPPPSNIQKPQTGASVKIPPLPLSCTLKYQRSTLVPPKSHEAHHNPKCFVKGPVPRGDSVPIQPSTNTSQKLFHLDQIDNMEDEEVDRFVKAFLGSESIESMSVKNRKEDVTSKEFVRGNNGVDDEVYVLQDMEQAAKAAKDHVVPLTAVNENAPPGRNERRNSFASETIHGSTGKSKTPKSKATRATGKENIPAKRADKTSKSCSARVNGAGRSATAEDFQVPRRASATPTKDSSSAANSQNASGISESRQKNAPRSATPSPGKPNWKRTREETGSGKISSPRKRAPAESARQVNVPPKRNNQERFRCPDCETDFRYKSDLWRHADSRLCEAFACPFCREIFASVDHVKSHWGTSISVAPIIKVAL